MLVNKLVRKFLLVLLLAAAPTLWAQAGSQAAQPGAGASDRMAVPAPVSGEGLPLAYSTEAPRTNYLRGGINVQSAYENNIIPSSVSPASDVDYLISPMINFTVAGGRARWELFYSPTFTMYQHNSALDHIDHDLALRFQYRLSPHVTLNLDNSFSKATNTLPVSDVGSGNSGVGMIQKPNLSILAPATERISDFGNVEITYQFGRNSMVGVKGTVSELWYPKTDVTAATFLYDSTAQAAEAFYAQRVSRKLYLGVSYDFQKLLAHPSVSTTQAHSIVLFNTIYLRPNLSLSVFAGPQLSDTHNGPQLSNTYVGLVTPLRLLSPQVGASLSWTGPRTSVAAGYGRRIAEGGGLSGAVRSSDVDLAIRRRVSKGFDVELGGSYSINSILDNLAVNSGGHVVSGGITLQHPLKEHLGLKVGYTRLHQTFTNVPGISDAAKGNSLWTPDGDRAWISVSYEFERALGR